MAKKKTTADEAPDDTAVDETETEAPERAAVPEAPTADTDAEFPTAWHRDAYVADLEREIAGAERRVEELAALADTSAQALKDAQALVDNATAELARVTKKKG